ncbi:thioredoxin domain-containing protein [Eudoraea adriatica]
MIFKVALRDETPELINLFLTNGAMPVPMLIMLDKRS